MSRDLALFSICLLGILTSACASAPPPKAESAPESQVQEPPTPTRTADDQDSPTRTGQESADTPRHETNDSSASTDVDDSTSSVRYKATVIDEMTAGGTAYIIDYPNSGPMAAATKSCSEKAARAEEATKAEEAVKAARAAREAKPAKPASSEEPATANDQAKAAEAAEAQEAARSEKIEAVREECMKQAREKFEADVLRFRRNGPGPVQLVISRRNGSAVKELSVTNVELKQISGDTVRVEIKEGGLGQRPIMKDRSSFDVKIPNGYSIELEDPRLGKLPYIAKVGFVAN
jgi:hypothetical protein